MKRLVWFLVLVYLKSTESFTLPRRNAASRATVVKPARSVASSTSQQQDDDRTDNNPGMSLALAATYFSVMGAKCALPSVLHLLLQSGLTTTRSLSTLLTLSTLAVATGKLVLGPVIDSFGGIRSLQWALLSLAVLLFGISVCHSFWVFAVAWIGVDFVFSSCWAACLHAIHQSFGDQQWGRQIGRLAAAARLGNAAAFGAFAIVLGWFEDKLPQPWRPVFAIAAVTQIFPVILLSVYGRTATQRAARTSTSKVRDTIDLLRHECRRPQFWLHLISRSCLMVFASFLLFVPSLLSQVYDASSATAARAGSAYALGCLSSVTLGSDRFSKLSRKGKLSAIALLLAGAIASSVAQLAHVSGWLTLSSNQAIACLFVWGFCFAIPFYCE